MHYGQSKLTKPDTLRDLFNSAHAWSFCRNITMHENKKCRTSVPPSALWCASGQNSIFPPFCYSLTYPCYLKHRSYLLSSYYAQEHWTSLPLQVPGLLFKTLLLSWINLPLALIFLLQRGDPGQIGRYQPSVSKSILSNSIINIANIYIISTLPHSHLHLR